MIASEGGIPPDHEVAADGFHEFVFVYVRRIGKKGLANTTKHLGIVTKFILFLKVLNH